MKKMISLLLVFVFLLLCAGPAGAEGGIVLDFSVALPEGADGDFEALMDATLEVIRNRLDASGMTEAVLTRIGHDVIQVEYTGDRNSEFITKLITPRGLLEFVDPAGNVFMTGEMVKSASYYFNDEEHMVFFELTDKGRDIFAEETTKAIGRQIAIRLDGEELIAPTIQSAITEGYGVINGLESRERAEQIAAQIQSGILLLVLCEVR